MKTKKVLVIAGPTGVGESTITKEIIKKYPIFKRLVTATTRKPRLNEKDKQDYYFFSKEKFIDEIKKGTIIEYTYIESRDVYYGSYKDDLEDKLDNGFNIIVNPDIVGAKYYKRNYDAVTIFIKPESLDNLRKRHLDRDINISNEELEKRMEYARFELEEEADFYDYQIVNEYGKLEKTMKEVEDVIKKEGYEFENK